MLDLTGDGLADVLLGDDHAFVWYESLGELGFAEGQRVARALDEERGPRVVFAAAGESVFVADLSGDGLSDLVRIRNGEVCYWPNLGYGHFGAKVTMDGAPSFDLPDRFDAKRLQLADLDGSGTSDLVYFAADGPRIYFNQSGNAWSAALALPQVDGASFASVVDLLGNGTACLVWSSTRTSDAPRAMRYVDLMGGQKPHLLIASSNNLGGETRVEYAPSTRFYVQDRRAGKPWITRLPFPVHVVERVETLDHVSRTRFVSRYSYHHGHFDGEEREFAGFGRVERFDSEQLAVLSAEATLPADNVDAASHVPPLCTKSWFHTGVFLGHERVSRLFAGQLDADDRGEYYREPGLNDDQARARLLADTVLPDSWSASEAREAVRALRGSLLREEVYALDGSALQAHPYTVTEQSFTLQRLQPRAGNRHAVFSTHARETLSQHYERRPQDPRVAHALTLEVDAFGNVCKSLAIAYARRTPDPGLDPSDQRVQATALAVYTEAVFTAALTDPARFPDAHRPPLPAESRSYELTGFGLRDDLARAPLERWTQTNFQALRSAPSIAHDATAPPGQPSKRLIGHSRSHYRADDLESLLPLFSLQPLALPGESFRLAFTAGLADRILRRRAAGGALTPLLPNLTALLVGRGDDGGGYVDLDRDGSHWIPSGRSFFATQVDVAQPANTAAAELAEARDHFFLPRAFSNPFRARALVDYDAHDLLPVRSEDAVGNETSAELDYRVLGASAVIDPNGNRSEVAYDVLGMPTGIARRGKPGDDPGDSLAGFAAELSASELDAFYDAADPLPLAAQHLAHATTRFVHDVQRFHRTRRAFPQQPQRWMPAYAATIARETHRAELPAGSASRLQLSFSYGAGAGHV
ncbi:MAG TPA: toxin TcdB middle/C-terminal domain-containing protein, partial [Polyangiales bacterium]|nr:toxin TcdB middle/C-terminal domain-containing protein [Polyangiales bacterium]